MLDLFWIWNQKGVVRILAIFQYLVGICSALSFKRFRRELSIDVAEQGSCHKRQKPQAPTPQAPIRNRQTRKVANAKGLINRNTNLT